MSLALDLLTGAGADRASLEARIERDGVDALWDDPRLPGALRGHRGLSAPSAPLFLYVMLRHLLRELGVDDRAVTDYCASLLLAFGRGDRAWRTSDHDENRTAYLVDLVAEAGRAEGERRFRVTVHLGNFALWMTGIFPDYIAERRARKGGPGLGYFQDLGRSGFLEASGHELAGRCGLDGVLRTAGEEFPRLRVAMNRLSDGLMFPRHHSVERLLRQVADG